MRHVENQTPPWCSLLVTVSPKTPQRNHHPDFTVQVRFSGLCVSYKWNQRVCDLLCLASFTQCYVWKICPCRCICSQWSLGFCMNRPIYLLLMGTWVIPSLGLLHIVLITFYFVILVNQLHIFVGPILRSERTASQGIHMFSISRYCQRVFQKRGCTILHSHQQPMRVPVLSCSHQHLANTMCFSY